MTATKRKGVRGGKDVLIAQQSRQNVRAEASKGNEKLVTIESSASIMDSEFDATNLVHGYTLKPSSKGGAHLSLGKTHKNIVTTEDSLSPRDSQNSGISRK